MDEEAPIQLRLHGVVRARRLASQRLSGRLSSREFRDLQTWAAGIVAQVEQLCAAHHVEPASLAAPTYHAYLFLHELSKGSIANQPAASAHTKKMPASRPAEPPAQAAPRSAQLRLNGLNRQVAAFQDRLSEAALLTGPEERARAQQALLAELTVYHNHLLAELAHRQASPASLTPPARRAYGWIWFLSQPENLAAHIEALRCVYQAALNQKIAIQVEFFPQAYIYHTRQQGAALHLVAHEALIDAPPELLHGLIEIVRHGRRSKQAAALRAYSAGPSYARLLSALEPDDHPAAGARGQFFDLEQVFNQINHEYFAGELPMPTLRWSRRISQRKLGHYSPATDTVEVSKSLDQPGVPGVIVDFIMYHELLHKSLGVKMVNGRRMAHTAAFRRAEQRFKQYDQAAAWMKKRKYS